MNNYLNEIKPGQWVWFWSATSILKAEITRIENGICFFETEDCKTIKTPKEKCYKSLEELIKSEKMIEKNAGELFGENYYVNGIESGISNYVDYRWMPELTLPMAKSFMEIFGVEKRDIVLDFGCSRGYFVRALREHGVDAYGVDISEWAIKNCDETVKKHVFNDIDSSPVFFDYLFSKDVLEHIPDNELTQSLIRLLSCCREAAVFIVPLAKSEGGEYIYPSDELDKTHIHRKTLNGWVDLIQPFAQEFTIFTSTKIPILKKATEQYPGCAGIIYCKKIKK